MQPCVAKRDELRGVPVPALQTCKALVDPPVWVVKRNLRVDEWIAGAPSRVKPPLYVVLEIWEYIFLDKDHIRYYLS